MKNSFQAATAFVITKRNSYNSENTKESKSFYNQHLQQRKGNALYLVLYFHSRNKCTKRKKKEKNLVHSSIVVTKKNKTTEE